MTMKSWIRNLFARPATRTIRKVPHRARLALETLEDRAVPALVAWWQAENNADDSVGGHNGTPELGATYAAGHNGQAFSFDGTGIGGTGARVVVPDSEDFDGTGGFSVAAWIKPSDNGFSEDQIVSKSDHGVPSGWEFRRYGTRLEFTFRSTDANQYGVAADNVLQIGQWNLVVGTWDQSTLKIYVNGDLVGSQATAGGMLTNNFPLVIGENSNLTEPFSPPEHGAFFGLIDEVKYFDHALTEAEVQSMQVTQLQATAWTQGTINLGSNGKIVLHLAIDAGQLNGTDTVASLFDGATFTIAIQKADGSVTYGMLTSVAKVASNGNITVSLQMDDDLRAVLYDAYVNGAAVNFNMTATSNNGNYAIDGNTLSRLLNNGAFQYVP